MNKVEEKILLIYFRMITAVGGKAGCVTVMVTVAPSFPNSFLTIFENTRSSDPPRGTFGAVNEGFAVFAFINCTGSPETCVQENVKYEPVLFVPSSVTVSPP